MVAEVGEAGGVVVGAALGLDVVAGEGVVEAAGGDPAAAVLDGPAVGGGAVAVERAVEVAEAAGGEAEHEAAFGVVLLGAEGAVDEAEGAVGADGLGPGGDASVGCFDHGGVEVADEDAGAVGGVFEGSAGGVDGVDFGLAVGDAGRGVDGVEVEWGVRGGDFDGEGFFGPRGADFAGAGGGEGEAGGDEDAALAEEGLAGDAGADAEVAEAERREGLVPEGGGVGGDFLEGDEVGGAGGEVLGLARECLDADGDVPGDQAHARAAGMRCGLGSVNFDDHLDFDGHAGGEAGDADGAAGMPAAVAEDFDEEVAGAVGDLGMFLEFAGGVDEAEEFDDAGDAVEGTDFGAEGGEQLDGDGACGLAALFDVHVAAEASADELAV